MHWNYMSCRALALVTSFVLLSWTASQAGGADPTRADSLSLKQKVATIAAFGERPSRQPNRTTVTEAELNAYFLYDGRDQLPPGLVEPAIAMVGAGRVSARAVVDLDAVRKQRAARGLLDPMGYLAGRLPVAATGVLTADNGTGRIQLESASVSGLPVPKMLLQEIVSYYSRTQDNPSGLNLDGSFALPSGIREIQVERGQAIVIQ